MPQLKQLSCTIQWAGTGAPFPEYGTVYGDGLVETFVVVPNKPQPFTIHLKSLNFIYEGLSMVVFVDGNYQANRNRVNLKPHKKTAPLNNSQVDFLLRQREKPIGDGVYMGREWRFDNHNIVEELPDGVKESHFELLGTIEVLVLRCRARIPEELNDSDSSSAADSDALCEKGQRIVIEEEEKPKKKPSNKDGTESAEEDEDQIQNASRSAIPSTDGPSDPKYTGSFNATGPNSHGQYSRPTWHNVHPNCYHHPSQIYHNAYPQSHHGHQGSTEHSSAEPPQAPTSHKHVRFAAKSPPPTVPRPQHSNPASHTHSRQPSLPHQNRFSQTNPSMHPGSAHTASSHHAPLSAPRQSDPPAISGHDRQPQMIPPFYSGSIQHAPPNMTQFSIPNSYGPLPQYRYPPNLQARLHPAALNLMHNQPWPIPPPYLMQTPYVMPPMPFWPSYPGMTGSYANSSPATVPSSSRGSNSGGSNHQQSTRSDQNQGTSTGAGDWSNWQDNSNSGTTVNATGSENNTWGGVTDNQQSKGNEEWDKADSNGNWADSTGVNNNSSTNDWPDGPTKTGNDNSVNNNQDNDWDNNNSHIDTWANNNANNDWIESGNDQVNGSTNDIANGAAGSTEVARSLFGPHGQYYTYYPRGPDEPAPDAEEEPRYDVPKNYAEATGSTKQVLPGSGYMYWKRRRAPEYIDTLEEPYARFVFKYRTKDQLEQETGIKVEVEPTGDEAIQELQVMDKQALIEMLVRAKSALGGKVPSPPLKPAKPTGANQIPVPVDPPDHDYLKYKLPELRQSKADTADTTSNKAAQSGLNTNNKNNNRPTGSTGNNGHQDWNTCNNDTTTANGGGWDSGIQSINANVNWKSPVDGTEEQSSTQQTKRGDLQPQQQHNGPNSPFQNPGQNDNANSVASSPATLPLDIPFNPEKPPYSPPPPPATAIGNWDNSTTNDGPNAGTQW